MNIRLLFAIILFLSISTSGGAQIQVLPRKIPPMTVSVEISEETRDSLVGYIQALVNKYAELGTLLDRDKEVNEKSINRFSKLFLPNAELQADYRETPGEKYNTVSEYTYEIYRRLRFDGIKVRIESAEISEIKYDVDGFYTIELKISKLIYNPLDENNMVKTVASGKRVVQLVTVSAEQGDLENPRIYRIRGYAPFKQIPIYIRLRGITAGLGMRSFNVNPSSLWESNHSTSEFLVSSGPVISGGFEYATNRLPFNSEGKGNLFFNFGLFWEKMTVNTNIREFGIDYFSSIAADQGNDQIQYARKVSDLHAKEEIGLTSVVMPLGVSLRVSNNPKTCLLLSFQVKPGIVIKTGGVMAGRGNYSAYLSASNWDTDQRTALNALFIENPNAYQPLVIGERELSGTPGLELRSVNVTTSLSPRYYRRLSTSNPAPTLMLGVDFSLGLTSPLRHTAGETELFTFPDRYEGSILTHYTDGLTTMGISFMIGIHQQLSSK